MQKPLLETRNNRPGRRLLRTSKAAQELGCSVSFLKKFCDRHGIDPVGHGVYDVAHIEKVLNDKAGISSHDYSKDEEDLMRDIHHG